MEKLAVLGPRGTFSDSAAREYAARCGGEWELCYYPTIGEAFRAVGGECARGIVPVENTLDGYVQRTLDLLLEGETHILGELTIPVAFSLAANAGDLGEVKRVFVQFKAGGQCRRFLEGLAGVQTITTESNMDSFYRLREGAAGDAAVIPRHMLDTCGELLTVEDITDSSSNFTRFLAVAPGPVGEPALRPDRKLRIPLYLLPRVDEPGVLFRMLRGFSERRINLVSIMSRPTRLGMGSYNFYLEVDGDYSQRDAILRVLEELGERHVVKVLGIYQV